MNENSQVGQKKQTIKQNVDMQDHNSNVLYTDIIAFKSDCDTIILYVDIKNKQLICPM